MSYVCPPKQTNDKLNFFFCMSDVCRSVLFLCAQRRVIFCGGNFKDSNQDFPSRQSTVSDGKHVYVTLLTLANHREKFNGTLTNKIIILK